MAKSIQVKKNIHDCPKCKSQCCKSVTIEIDTPHSKKDFDEIKWFVLHENVIVYIDTERKWNLEFVSPCKALDKNGLCTIYKDRPIICRLYPKSDESCVFEDNPCRKIFTKAEEVTAYFDKKKARRTKKRLAKKEKLRLAEK